MPTTFINPADLSRLVHLFDILAAVVFAVSGALVASRKGMDVMGFMWLAVITGVGGGTVRDLILDVPVFWVQNPVHVSACLVTAVVMHFVAPRVESRYQTLLWFDADAIPRANTIAVTAAATLRTRSGFSVASSWHLPQQSAYQLAPSGCSGNGLGESYAAPGGREFSDLPCGIFQEQAAHGTDEPMCQL
jgi:hypothetical protein